MVVQDMVFLRADSLLSSVVLPKKFQGSKLEKESLFIYFFTQQMIYENTEAMWECRTDLVMTHNRL